MSPRARSALFALLMVAAFAAWCKAQDMLRPFGSSEPAPVIITFEPEGQFELANEGGGSAELESTSSASTGDTSFMQSDSQFFSFGGENANLERFALDSAANPYPMDVGVDFYFPPEFKGGLIIRGRDVAMKIGGYVKADFIYDFDPIDSTDSFITTTIPVGAPPRTNATFHAKQTRLSVDTRWPACRETVRAFVEGDFFSEGNQFRLRHAYGEVGSLLVGQTLTTFSDAAASPPTLDFEGSVSNIKLRQAQARWTQRSSLTG